MAQERNKVWSKVVLTIDLGSTSLRSGLMRMRSTRSGDDWIRITNPKHRYSSRHHGSEWPIKLFLDDRRTSGASEPIWRNNKESDDQLAISAKYAILWLANDTGLREQYCIIEPLYNYTGGNLAAKLYRGLVELFTALRGEVQKTCERNFLDVQKIVLSIPSQWTDVFRDIYLKVVLEAFSGIIGESDVHFVKEVEGIAHYTFRAEESCYWNTVRPREQEMALFLDFGGHSLNCCRYLVKYNGYGGMPNLYLDGDFDGVGGGSEHWEYLLVEECKRLARNGIDPCELTSEALLIIAKDLNRDKRGEIGPGTATHLTIPYHQNGKAGTVTLRHDTIVELFEQGFSKPFEIAEREIRQLKANGGSLVIVTGASTLHSGLQARISSMCEKVGLQEAPMFMEETIKKDEAGMKVYMGAAYATAETITTRNFMDRGAAFALQRHVQGGEIYPLFSKARATAKIEFRATGSDDWKIICDPFHNQRTTTSPEKATTRSRDKITQNFEDSAPVMGSTRTAGRGATGHLQPVSFRNSYDVVCLGIIGRGWWTLEVNLRDPKNRHEHADLVNSTGHHCTATTQELCLQIKILHKSSIDGDQQVLGDLFTNVYINEGTHCAHFECDDNAETSLRAIFEPDRRPKPQPQKKGPGRPRKRRRKGFRGIPFHEMQKAARKTPEELACDTEPCARSGVSRQGSMHREPETAGSVGHTSSEGQQVSVLVEDTLPHEPPAMQHDVELHDACPPDRTATSWFDAFGEPHQEHSSHDFTMDFSADKQDPSDRYAMDYLGDDLGLGVMSFLGDGNEHTACETPVLGSGASTTIEPRALPGNNKNNNDNTDKLPDNAASSDNHPHTTTRFAASQSDADSEKEFSHIAPKYQRLENSRVPEADMGLPSPMVTLHKHTLEQHLAQSTPSSLLSAVTPALLHCASSNPAITSSIAVATPSSASVHPSFTVSTFLPKTLPTAEPAATATTSTAAQHPRFPQASTSTSMSNVQVIDLTTSPDTRRKAKSMYAIRGGKGGRGRGGRNSGNSISDAQRKERRWILLSSTSATQS